MQFAHQMPTRSPTAPPAADRAEAPVRASDEVLQHATELLEPLVRLLIHHGIDHPRFAAALKRVFVDVALAELGGAAAKPANASRRGRRAAAGSGAAGPEPTHTAVGLLTGLQRRDVKALREGRGGARWPAKALSPTLPMQAVTRWAHEERYLDAQGRPRPLPMRRPDDGQPSFDELAESLSKDMHAPALRDELVRLGLARDDDGLVTLLSRDFVPPRDVRQSIGAMSRNAHDHLAAAVTNLLEGQQRFLDYSLVADELHAESAAALLELARKLWSAAYRQSVQAATAHVARDKQVGFSPARPEMRVRFGAYFYSEPVARDDGEP